MTDTQDCDSTDMHAYSVGQSTQGDGSVTRFQTLLRRWPNPPHQRWLISRKTRYLCFLRLANRGLLETLTGQVTEVLSRNRRGRW